MTYIIAEAGVDHEGHWARMKALFHAAHDSGADCLKIQYYKKGMRGPNRELPWLGERYIKKLDKMCRDSGLAFLITPHDKWALDFLYDELGHTTCKIGSGDWNLIADAFDLGVDMIISTGMKTADDLGYLIQFKPYSILHCVSEYPTPPENVNLQMINHLKYVFLRSKVGYSDHTSNNHACYAAVAMGAEIVEKHLTLQHGIPGRQDTYVSNTPRLFQAFVSCIRNIEEMLEYKEKVITPGEQETLDWVTKRNIDSLKRG